MKLNKIAQVLVAAACFASATAYADTKFFNTTEIVNTDADLADYLSFQQFDSKWGTLTGVHIDVYSDVSGSFDFTNTGSAAKKVTAILSVDLDLLRPDTTSIVQLVNAEVFNKFAWVDGGASASIGGAKKISGWADLSSEDDLLLFTGKGSVLASMSVTANTFTDGSNISGDFSTKANGYGTVTYTYTAAPVPEPETYGMLLLGMGLLAGVAKRKSRATQA